MPYQARRPRDGRQSSTLFGNAIASANLAVHVWIKPKPNFFANWFVRKHLVFVSLLAEPLLQIAVGAFASEAAACVGLFSKMRLVHRCAPFEAGAHWLSVTGTCHGPYGDLASLNPNVRFPTLNLRAWV